MMYLVILGLCLGLADVTSVVTTAEALRSHVKFLASAELEGRMTGSEGERKAGDYAKNWFTKYSLLPAGESGTYFQHFDATVGLTNTADTSLVVHLSNGKTLEAKVGEDYNAVANTSAEAIKGASLVFVGEGIVNESRNDYANLDVTGKVVVVIPSADQRSASNRQKGQWAKEKGAIGIVFAGVLSGDVSKAPLPTMRNGLRRDTEIVGGWISARFFEKISGLKYSEAKSQAQLGRVMPGFASGLKVDLQSGTEPNRVKGRSVMALLPGQDPTMKHQYIVLGAHMDHVGHGGTGSTSGNDSIHFGADDNASGTAAILELAKYFAENKTNKRTLVFQLYSGEELGLLGSTHFVRNPTIVLENVAAMLNFDMVGNLTNNRLLIDGVRSSPTWPGLLDKLGTGFDIVRDPRGQENVAGRSDHAAFERQGIPVLFFWTGFHDRYHNEKDTWDLLNYEGQARIVTLAAQVIEEIDKSEKMPPFLRQGQVTDRTPKAPPVMGDSSGRRVRVGFIPEYADAGPGLLLAGVSEGSPAEKAGLRAGDRILKWGEQTIQSIEDLQEVLSIAEPGKPVQLVVRRDGKDLIVTVIPDGTVVLQ
jgi:aminopeptidase YwaD